MATTQPTLCPSELLKPGVVMLAMVSPRSILHNLWSTRTAART